MKKSALKYIVLTLSEHLKNIVQLKFAYAKPFFANVKMGFFVYPFSLLISFQSYAF